jgi:hypothetical protein
VIAGAHAFGLQVMGQAVRARVEVGAGEAPASADHHVGVRAGVAEAFVEIRELELHAAASLLRWEETLAYEASSTKLATRSRWMPL